ncbi:MAG: DUF1415 domain-containing protein [Oligoflexia bacterium]|nr:DUF1415 domain-containing protein [Oligoflexia bacterium]
MSLDSKTDFEDSQKIIDKTVSWLETIVIGLNLCPFAKAVHTKKQIRYVVTQSVSSDELLKILKSELKSLHATNPNVADTTLIIHPQCLKDFLDYNEFLQVAENAIAQIGLEGVLQLASFHPQYQFAGSEPDAIDNYTNRSPYPMLHILREASVSKAVELFPEAVMIPANNVETMNTLGFEKLKKLLDTF